MISRNAKYLSWNFKPSFILKVLYSTLPSTWYLVTTAFETILVQMSVFKFIFKRKRINKSTDIAEASFSLSHDVPEAWWKEAACNSSLRDLWMPSCYLPSAFEWKSLKPILEKTTGKKFSGRKSQGLFNIKEKYVISYCYYYHHYCYYYYYYYYY